MIAHEIVVVKSVNVYQGTFPVTTHATPYPNITDQSSLDTWLTTTPFSVGDYVTFLPNPMLPQAVEFGVSVIVEMEKDFTTMTTTSYSPYHPLLIQRKGLPREHEGAMVQGHVQWDNIKSMRKVTENEWNTLVKPYLDRVRDSCKSQA
jgi:hypothetical protein